MKSRNPIQRVLTFAISIIAGIVLSGVVNAQSPANPPPPPLLQQMAGTWDVQQRMWPGAGAEAVALPPAVAKRTVLAGGFLEEVMEPVGNAPQDSFRRTAYFNYNAVNKQFEYFSLDSRAPQMMNERSEPADQQASSGKGDINLRGGKFTAPQWGPAKNVSFTYRLTVGPVENDKQVVKLFLKPQAGDNQKEFVGFEYVYTRQH